MQLSDVKGDEFLKIEVVSDFLKSVERHLRLTLEVGNVREIVLCCRLKLAFYVQYFVQRDARLLIVFELKMAMPQLEAVLISTWLGQFPHTNLIELLGGHGIISAFVVVVGQLPTRFQCQWTFGKFFDKRIHAVNSIAMVQSQCAHGCKIIGFHVGVARFTGRFRH